MVLLSSTIGLDHINYPEVRLKTKTKTFTFCLGINTVHWFQVTRVVRVGNGGQVTCPGSHSWDVSEARLEPRTSHL